MVLLRYNTYDKYKPSGVEWLGNVPDHWGVKRLKYSTTINDDTLPETTPPDYELFYVDIGSVDPVHGIQEKELMVFDDAPSRARRVVRDGDSIISTVRTYLKAISSIKNPEDNLVVSTGFAVVRPRRINAGYLSYALRTPYFVETVVSRSVGVSYPAINASQLGIIDIPLPEPTEQQAIADFLDYETDRIDKLVEKKRQFIEALKEKRTAMVSHAVAEGLNSNVKLKPSGIGWLGDVPTHWGITPLKYLARFRSGENITYESIDISGAFPVFGGNGLRGYTDAYTHKGDYVLIGRQGAQCGNIHLVRGEFWASEHAVVATPCTKYDARWFSYVLTSMNLNQYSETAAQPGLSMERVRRLKVAVPSLDEQRQIADYLVPFQFNEFYFAGFVCCGT